MEISWLLASAYVMDGPQSPHGECTRTCTVGHIYVVSPTLQTAGEQMWENILWNIRHANPMPSNAGLGKLLASLCSIVSSRPDLPIWCSDITLRLDFMKMLLSCVHFPVLCWLWCLLQWKTKRGRGKQNQFTKQEKSCYILYKGVLERGICHCNDDSQAASAKHCFYHLPFASHSGGPLPTDSYCL